MTLLPPGGMRVWPQWGGSVSEGHLPVCCGGSRRTNPIIAVTPGLNVDVTGGLARGDDPRPVHEVVEMQQAGFFDIM